MCGFVGFIINEKEKFTQTELLSKIRHMASTLIHRGPDDSGAWVDIDFGLAFGHQRLAIQDLTNAGHQPMVSACSRYVIVLNGEIYNHLEMRKELESNYNLKNEYTSPKLHQLGGINLDKGEVKKWNGHSDTETLLAAVAAWGVEKTLNKCVGMFAFGLWDRLDKTLTLARDRFGEKPLYYGWSGEGKKQVFVFGSELKGLVAFSNFKSKVCRQALAEYVRYMYIPAPRSIYKGIFKLEPGCFLTICGRPPDNSPAQPIQPGYSYENLRINRWWSLGCFLMPNQSKKIIQSDAVACEELEKKLTEAITLQSLADVPLGAFLSGGIDSSTIVALMQIQSPRPVKTFTIGFEESGFDESPYARAVADHLKTDHYEMRVTSQMALNIIPTLPWMYDEPFADSSQIPTHLICKTARQHVTVALSGDAGDELFGGYNRYFWGPKIWSRLAWMPFPMRQMLGKAIEAVSIEGWNVLSGLSGVSRLGDKAHKLASRLNTAQDIDSLCWSLVVEWKDPAALVKGDSIITHSPWENNEALPTQLNAVERMMFRDTMTYLPDDILCKVDRAAMASSLETRVPFLDHRVVEFAWQLPFVMKIRGATSKWALRQVLNKYVPKELIDRPKAGFAIPIGKWLRGPLRDWAEALLDESRLNQEGYFHSEPIRKAWSEHLSGQLDNTSKLWAILMFQSWLEFNSK